MEKIKFYLNLVHLCSLSSMEDKALRNYILQYVTDPQNKLDQFEEQNLISWDAKGLPFLTPKGFELLMEKPQSNGYINFRTMPDKRLVTVTKLANSEICRRYEANDKFCNKVHSEFADTLTDTVQCMVNTITTAVAVFDTEEDYLVAAQESLDNS